jgi:hypothetical protein
MHVFSRYDYNYNDTFLHRPFSASGERTVNHCIIDSGNWNVGQWDIDFAKFFFLKEFNSLSQFNIANSKYFENP